MAQIILRGCCKFCVHSTNFHLFGNVTKKTKLVCHHEDNANSAKNLYAIGITHENGWCEHFQWGDNKKTNSILSTFDNMKKEQM